jgi:hypothetical protein
MFSGYHAVAAKRLQRQLFERFGASFVFAAQRDDAWSEKISERREVNPHVIQSVPHPSR